MTREELEHLLDGVAKGIFRLAEFALLYAAISLISYFSDHAALRLLSMLLLFAFGWLTLKWAFENFKSARLLIRVVALLLSFLSAPAAYWIGELAFDAALAQFDEGRLENARKRQIFYDAWSRESSLHGCDIVAKVPRQECTEIANKYRELLRKP